MFNIYRLSFSALNEKGLNGQNRFYLNSHKPIKNCLSPEKVITPPHPLQWRYLKNSVLFSKSDQPKMKLIHFVIK